MNMTQIGAADLCSPVNQPPTWELYFGLVGLAMGAAGESWDADDTDKKRGGTKR